MTFNEFLMPTLPQPPAAGFKGSGAVRTTPDSPGHAAASDDGQSFLATLNEVSDTKPAGAADTRKSIPTNNRQASSEGSATSAASVENQVEPLNSVQEGDLRAAEIESLDASPLFYVWQTIGLIGSLPAGMGIIDQPYSLYETPSESLAADISPQTTTRLHFEHLMAPIGLNSDAEGPMDMHAQFIRFWQWLAQMTQTNAAAPAVSPVSQSQMAVSDPIPVYWPDSIFAAMNSDHGGPGGKPVPASMHAIQALEAFLNKMEFNSETHKAGGFENPKMGLWAKDHASPPGTLNDSLLAMPLDAAPDARSKIARQSRVQTRHSAVAHSTIQNPSVTDTMAPAAGKTLNSQGPTVKTQVPTGDGFGAKIVQVEGEAKDSGLLYGNDPMLERNFKLEDASRKSAPLQRYFSADTLNQIVQKAILSLKNGQNEARIDLKPDFLGHIRMQIVTENQQVAVKIYAEFPFVKDMLESNLHQLKSELQAHGLAVDELEVSVGYESDRETDLNHKAVELKRSKATDLNRPTDGDTSQETVDASSASGEGIQETAIDYFA